MIRQLHPTPTQTWIFVLLTPLRLNPFKAPKSLPILFSSKFEIKRFPAVKALRGKSVQGEYRLEHRLHEAARAAEVEAVYPNYKARRSPTHTEGCYSSFLLYGCVIPLFRLLIKYRDWNGLGRAMSGSQKCSYKKIYMRFSCEIEDFVDTHLASCV